MPPRRPGTATRCVHLVAQGVLPQPRLPQLGCVASPLTVPRTTGPLSQLPTAPRNRQAEICRVRGACFPRRRMTVTDRDLEARCQGGGRAPGTRLGWRAFGPARDPGQTAEGAPYPGRSDVRAGRRGAPIGRHHKGVSGHAHREVAGERGPPRHVAALTDHPSAHPARAREILRRATHRTGLRPSVRRHLPKTPGRRSGHPPAPRPWLPVSGNRGSGPHASAVESSRATHSAARAAIP